MLKINQPRSSPIASPNLTPRQAPAAPTAPTQHGVPTAPSTPAPRSAAALAPSTHQGADTLAPGRSPSAQGGARTPSIASTPSFPPGAKADAAGHFASRAANVNDSLAAEFQQKQAARGNGSSKGLTTLAQPSQPLPMNASGKGLTTLAQPSQPLPMNASSLTTRADYEALAKKHNGTLLAASFQDDRLGGSHTSHFPQAADGVCDGMTAQWVKSNLHDQKVGGTDGADAFRDVVKKNNLDSFAIGQEIQVGERNRLKEMGAQEKNLHAEAERAIDQFKNPNSISNFYRKAVPEAEVNAKINAANAESNKVRAAQQKYHNDVVGGLSTATAYNKKPFTTPDPNDPQKNVNTLETNFLSHLPKEQGFSMVSLGHPDAAVGHVIGVHNGKEPRLMDANTGEWGFKSHADMNAYMKTYMKESYGNDYEGGHYSVVHYPDAKKSTP